MFMVMMTRNRNLKGALGCLLGPAPFEEGILFVVNDFTLGSGGRAGDAACRVIC
jgi:hypothetical protein